MPLMWDGRNAHSLGKNFNLARQILLSTLKKYKNSVEKLKQMDDKFRDQVEKGVIERIDNLNEFKESHPAHSFLAHMPVFKPDRDTTKCRMVFLSNLCEKDPDKPLTLSHNQTILTGPCLNRKLSTALLQLRFDKYLLCFDIKKAFLQIALNSIDSARLLFLWFKNVERKNFDLVAYQCKRLPFGLRISPAILMLAIFKILMVDTENDSEDVIELKKLAYDLIYMDNGSFTSNDSLKLEWAYKKLGEIFQGYCFELQQHITNEHNLKDIISNESEESMPTKSKLFGLLWDNKSDHIIAKKLKLNPDVKTKRLILQSIASNFDLFNFYGPILNRARLFLHELQCDQNLGWDTPLSPERLKEWKNISKQINNSPELSIQRFVGKRSGKFRLIAFTDSSKLIYGTVVFIQDVDTNEVKFLLAKNRLVNKTLESKSIPSLEFQAVALGVDVLIDTYKELAGSACIVPINVIELKLFSDSMVSLHWLNSYSHKMRKMQKRSVFILNRLKHITEQCEIFPISFNFVSGIENPADLITRPISYKQLEKSNYFTGPSFLKNPNQITPCDDDIVNIIIPNPLVINKSEKIETAAQVANVTEPNKSDDQLISLDRFSSFHCLVSAHRYALKFWNNLKKKLKSSNPDKYSHIVCIDTSKVSLYEIASRMVVEKDQSKHYSHVLNFMKSKNKVVKDMPPIIGQLNLFLDKNGIIRVHSKFDRWKDHSKYCFPILLAKDSIVTQLIISDLHERFSHAGCYIILSELRKSFWVSCFFSIVKKFLRRCVTCKRNNEKNYKTKSKFLQGI